MLSSFINRAHSPNTKTGNQSLVFVTKPLSIQFPKTRSLLPFKNRSMKRERDLLHNMWRFDRTLSPDRGRHALHCSLLNFCTHLHALPSFSLPSARFRNFPTLQLAPDTFGSVPFKAYPTSPTSQLQRNESPYDWELSARASHETLLFTCKSSSLLPPTPSSFNVETMVCVLLFFVTTTNTIKQFLRNNCVPHNPVPEKSTLSLSLCP